MRYVNRRKLVIVAVLAALFGAALPYVQWMCTRFLPMSFDQVPPVEINLVLRLDGHDPFHARMANSLFDDHIGAWINTFDRKRIPDLDNLYHGLLPSKGWEHLYAGQTVELQRVGWPFRAIYSISSSGGVGSTDWSEYGVSVPAGVATWLPETVPVRALWIGFMGNIASAVLLCVTLFIGGSCIRSSHRRRRGKCWKCGYLSHGAAVCPECGVGAKA